MRAMSEEWAEWLQYFFSEADFGPAHEDVVGMIYQNFKMETGITLPEFEEEE